MERLKSIFITISLMLMIINVDKDMAAAAPATLHFYIQDIKTGPNVSGYTVATASVTPQSPTNFGRLNIFYKKMTVGPELDSAEVGYTQGIAAFADKQVLAISHVSNFVFTSPGEYNGSTIAIVGRSPLEDKECELEVGGKECELAVVGGTGAFRYARGYVITTTYMNMEDRTVMEYWIHLI